MNLGFLQFYLNTFNLSTGKNLEFLTELKYYAKNNWIFSIGLVIILFSMAGIPPLAGFFGKYFLFLTAFKSQYYLLVIVGMLTSLVSTFYYLRIIKILWFESDVVHFVQINNLLSATFMLPNQRRSYFAVEIILVLFVIFNKFVFSLTTILTTSCQLF